MNNEPVAWLWTKDGKPQSTLLHEPMTVPSDPYWKDKGFKAIPLYTHPVKELTDEEIQQAYVDHCKTEPSGKGNLIDFARAILRKAQEK
jgi:hypothetical protein